MAILRTGAQLAARKASSSSSSSSSSKSGRGKSEEMEVPQRSLLQEGREGLQLMQEAYPVLYNLQNEWNPQFAQLEARTGAARSAAETAAAQASGTSIRDTLRAGSPEIRASGDALLAGLQDVGPSAIETELNNQALAELKMGGQLSADEIRQVTQGSRAASASRGLGKGNSAAIVEVMSRAQMAESRKAGRRNFAAGVDVNRTQRKASDNAYVLNAGQQAMQHYDVFQRMYGTGGSQASGQVGGPAQFGNYLNAATNVGESNQSATIQGMAMQQDQNQFNINRKDSLMLSERNLANGNANAAAAQSNATKNAAISAGASIATVALLALI